MKTIIKGITTFALLSALALGQFRSQLPIQSVPVNTRGLSHAQGLSLLDPSRFSMNHNFGMNMMSFGGQSMSVGAYTNQMNYMIKDNLNLSTQFSLASPMGGVNPYAKKWIRWVSDLLWRQLRLSTHRKYLCEIQHE
jgi:hypothetical protein